MMKLIWARSVTAGLITLSLWANAETDFRLPDIAIEASRLPLAPGLYQMEKDTIDSRVVRDSAALLEMAPGAAVVRNGQQTGIIQLRGLSNDRVRIRVDGMQITPACPNHMDPPLHYIASQELETLQAIAGITPVSQGGDSIAGTVIAKSAPLSFGADKQFFPSAAAGISYNGSNNGKGFNVELGTANDSASLRYTADRNTGGDLRFPGGTAKDTGYDTVRQAVRIGTKTANGNVALELGVHRTRDAGTPSLPMDMIRDDANRVGLRYDGSFSFGSLEAGVYRHEVDHLMDNYSLRPVTGMRMFAPATSNDTGFSVSTSLPRGNDVYRAGVEYLQNDFNAYSQNAVNGVQQDLFRDNTRSRLGLFAEWQANPNEKWQTLAGLRSDSVASSAEAIVNRSSAPLSDFNNFNGGNRSHRDHNWDWAAQAQYFAFSSVTYEFGLARKVRSPSLVERYLWTPSNASAGQADNRTYIGNQDLNPEVSHQISIGADWHSNGWQVKPTLFYNRVSNYIQGTAGLYAANPAVLKYANVNAELYGLDGSWYYHSGRAWSLDGTFGYVRGRNTDNSDNLYRIAPLRGTINADYATGNWRYRGEWLLAARQDKVSAYNGEMPTGGYGVVNLRTSYLLQKGKIMHAGVENVFDKYYSDHLGGINRVADSDVPIGSHIPGAGRFVYLAFDYRM